jgi:hypothetical protein
MARKSEISMSKDQSTIMTAVGNLCMDAAITWQDIGDDANRDGRMSDCFRARSECDLWKQMWNVLIAGVIR